MATNMGTTLLENNVAIYTNGHKKNPRPALAFLPATALSIHLKGITLDAEITADMKMFLSILVTIATIVQVDTEGKS